MPARTYDVIVVGLGAMGAASTRALAARGASVLGLDRFHPPHSLGSSHGETRITRLAIGEGMEYVPLVRRSHELWREIERGAGVSLLEQVGGLVLAHRGDAFLERTRAAAEAHGIPHENLSADEIRRRHPMFALGEPTEGYYEPQAGYLRPEAGVRAQLELAVRDGARLRLGEAVVAWSASGGGVSVRTEAGSYAAERLVLSVGPWLSELLASASSLVSVHRQHLHWFPIREGYETLAGMPVFIWVLDGGQGAAHPPSFYGFPALDGPDGGMKVATESYDEPARADGRQHPTAPERAAAVHHDYVAQHLPWLGAPALRSASCLYTSTRDSRFVIDRHPDHDSVLVVSPCSGHGFKHSPAIGEAVAQWLLDGAPRLDLSSFRLPSATP